MMKLKLVFLTYVNRSGSTFLANKLSEIPRVLVCPEAEVLVYRLLLNPKQTFNYGLEKRSEVTHILEADKKLKYWGLAEQDISGLEKAKINFEAFLEILLAYKNKVRPGADTIIFKATKLIDLYDKINSVKQNVCEIKFISLIRDGRASYASQRITIDPYSGKRMNTNPVLAGILWSDFISKCVKGKEWFYILRYEDFVSNVEKWIKELNKYLDIEGEEDNDFKDDFYSRIPTDQKYLHTNVVKSADEKNIDKWEERLSSLQVYLFEKQSAEGLLKFDYLLIHPKVRVIKLFFVEVFYELKYFYWKLRHKY